MRVERRRTYVRVSIESAYSGDKVSSKRLTSWNKRLSLAEGHRSGPSSFDMSVFEMSEGGYEERSYQMAVLSSFWHILSSTGYSRRMRAGLSSSCQHPLRHLGR